LNKSKELGREKQRKKEQRKLNKQQEDGRV
jgi:hypothetical protein